MMFRPGPCQAGAAADHQPNRRIEQWLSTLPNPDPEPRECAVTPDELKSIRHQLGLTQRQLGEALGYNERDASTVRRWEYGARAIPYVVALLLRYMEKYGLPDEALD